MWSLRDRQSGAPDGDESDDYLPVDQAAEDDDDDEDDEDGDSDGETVRRRSLTYTPLLMFRCLFFVCLLVAERTGLQADEKGRHGGTQRQAAGAKPFPSKSLTLLVSSGSPEVSTGHRDPREGKFRTRNVNPM